MAYMPVPKSCLEKLTTMSDEEYRGMERDSVLDPE